MAVGTGIAERLEFDDFRADIVEASDCVELMTNGREADDLDWLYGVYRAYAGKRIHLHSTALSVASAELDMAEVAHAAALCHRLQPDTMSDHLSFRTAGDVHLENFVPPFLEPQAQALIRANVDRVQQACGQRFDLENVTHLMGDRAQLQAERDFLMDLCDDIGCGMVFDVNNLHIDSENFGFDAARFVDGMDLRHVATIHVAGFTVDGEGQLIDTHMERISDDVLDLLTLVLQRIEQDVDVILERDNGSATRTEILSELGRIRSAKQEQIEWPLSARAQRCADCTHATCQKAGALLEAGGHRRVIELPV